MSAIPHPHHGDDEARVHEGSVVIESSHQLEYDPGHEHGHEHVGPPRRRYHVAFAHLSPAAVAKWKRETRFGVAVVISFAILIGVLISKKGSKKPPINELKAASAKGEKPGTPKVVGKSDATTPPAPTQTASAPEPPPAEAAPPSPVPVVATKAETAEQDPLELPSSSGAEDQIKLASNEETQPPVPPVDTAKPADPMPPAQPKENADANHGSTPVPPADTAAEKGGQVTNEASATPPVDPNLASSPTNAPAPNPPKDPMAPSDVAAAAVPPAAAAGLDVAGASQAPPVAPPTTTASPAPTPEAPATPAPTNIASAPMPPTMPVASEAALANPVTPEAPAPVASAPTTEMPQLPAAPAEALTLPGQAGPAAEEHLPLPGAPTGGTGASALPAAAVGAVAVGAESLSHVGQQDDGKVSEMPNLDRTPSTPVASGAEAPASNLPADLVPIPNAGQRRFQGESQASTEPETEPVASTSPILDTIPVETPQADNDRIQPEEHVVRSGENFWTISREYYRSGRYYKALWKANRKLVAAPEDLAVGMTIIVPPPEELDKGLILPPQSAKRSEAIDPPSPVRKTSGQNVRTSQKGSAIKNAPEVELALPSVENETRRRPSSYRPPSDDYQGEEPERGNYRRYRIRRGDTLRKIARDKLGSGRRADEIFELNRDVLDNAQDELIPGQDISLPD